MNRIALISEHASPLATLGGKDSGGQNVYVAELAKHLVKKGYVIDIFTRKDSRHQKEVVSWLPGINVIHIKAGPAKDIAKEELFQHMPQFVSQMVSFINSNRIDYTLLHANFWMSGWVACEVKKLLSIPFVITYHALGYVRKQHQKEADKFPECRIDVEKRIALEADYIVAECPQDKSDLINFYQADHEKIVIIPCGFSHEEFFPINKEFARKKLKLPLDEKIILQLGRMVPRKGIDNAIRAAGILKRQHVKTTLLVVGGDSGDLSSSTCPELARLKDISASEEVSSSVIFAGSRGRDLLKFYYSAADIFITTPWYEPFGITPLEAMACGTPVIGANVGGIKYSVADGETGFLVPPHDPLALAGKIKLLIEDDKLLEDMGKNALKRVNTLFTWDKVADLTASMYDAVKKDLCKKVRKVA